MHLRLLTFACTQIHDDDISNVLILNKKAITNHENQLFKTELEKFRPHQNRILQANHKQSSLMKELTRTYSDLLQDKRVRGEQNKYEAFSRQRNSVLSKYRKVCQAYKDLSAGLTRAKQFYEEIKDTVESLKKNVESFVENRRSEGGQLLSAIEAAKGSGADREQARLKELMERMSVSPASATSPGGIAAGQGFGSNDYRSSSTAPPPPRPPPLQQQQYSHYSQQPQQSYNPAASPPITPRYQPNGSSNGMQSPAPYPQYQNQQHQPQQPQQQYNPNSYQTMSPPAQQQYFSPPPGTSSAGGYGQQQQQGQPQHQQYGGQMPGAGWQVPPPPPGGPPASSTSQDPWAGLGGWK
jgi:hypothetical protein